MIERTKPSARSSQDAPPADLSQHWATGNARILNGRDPSDPTGWSIPSGDTSAMPGDKAVKLETYIDADSNGTQASDWKKIGETVDDGNWTAPTGDCAFPANMVVTEGGGVVFIRNTDVGKVEYTKLSWREIAN